MKFVSVLYMPEESISQSRHVIKITHDNSDLLEETTEIFSNEMKFFTLGKMNFQIFNTNIIVLPCRMWTILIS